jgi:hypothetical protein
VIGVCIAPVLYVLWRDRSRIWSLEQRLSQLEAQSERFPAVEDRVSRVAGVLEFFAEGDPRVLDQLNTPDGPGRRGAKRKK